MYPAKFDYQRAATVDEAVSLLQQSEGAKLLAGGHSLLPAMKIRLATPSTLIDIGRIPGLNEIGGDRAGGWLIGALATHTAIARTVNGQGFEIMAEAANGIGDPQVRNRGTLGGNIAHADPASDWPTVLTALGATVEVTGPHGRRSLSAEEFFVDFFATALEEGEIIEQVRIPALNPPMNHGVGSAYAKLANPASRYAVIGAAVVVQVENGVCTKAGVAVGGLTPKATKAPAVEAALIGQSLTDGAIEAAAAQISADLDDNVNGDLHASAEYRLAVAPVYVARAIKSAAVRAG